MFKLLPGVLLILLLSVQLQAQVPATATARVTVSIIIPVGTEKSTDLMKGTFYPENKQGIVEFNNKGTLFTSNTGVSRIPDKADIPSFRVLGNQSTYSITLVHDPVMINSSGNKEILKIEKVQVIPDPERNNENKFSATYFITAAMKVGEFQVPGTYTGANPCRVTINYN